MTRKVCCALCFALAAMASVRAFSKSEAAAKPAEFQRVAKQVSRPALIGELVQPGRAPVYLFSGYECTDCDADIELLVSKASDAPLDFKRKDARRFVFPGRYSSYDDPKRLISETRAFYGSCIEGKSDVVIWVGARYARWNEKGEETRGKWDIREFIEPFENYELKQLSASAKVDASKMKTRKGCREIPGRDRLSPP